MTRRKWGMIGKGHSGWHTKGYSVKDKFGSTKTSSSSYDPTDEQLMKYANEAYNNCPVYDASEADSRAFVSFVISGPMVNLDLKKGEVERFGKAQKLTALQMCGPGGLTDGFAACIKRACSEPEHKIGSLDYVASDVYLALLRERVSGVRFGKVQQSKGKPARVLWEDGTESIG